MRAYILGGVFLASVAIAACVGDSPVGSNDSGSDASNDIGSGSDTSSGDGGAWVPSAFGVDLVLWLEGDVGLGLDDAGSVVSWKDQSLYPVTLATSGTGALTDVTPNGHTVVNFNATNVNLSTNSVSKLELGSSDDFIMAAAMQTTSGIGGPPGAFVWFKAQIGGHLPSAFLSDGLVFGTDIASSKADAPEIWDYANALDSGVTLTSTKNFDDGSYHVAIARRVGATSIHVKMDGLEETASLPVPIDVSQPTIPLSIGNVFWGEIFSGTFAFKLAEVVVVRRTGTFSAQDVGAVESYLKTKYAAK